jgi:hypothetical protein
MAVTSPQVVRGQGQQQSQGNDLLQAFQMGQQLKLQRDALQLQQAQQQLDSVFNMAQLVGNDIVGGSTMALQNSAPLLKEAVKNLYGFDDKQAGKFWRDFFVKSYPDADQIMKDQIAGFFGGDDPGPTIEQPQTQKQRMQTNPMEFAGPQGFTNFVNKLQQDVGKPRPDGQVPPQESGQQPAVSPGDLRNQMNTLSQQLSQGNLTMPERTRLIDQIRTLSSQIGEMEQQPTEPTTPIEEGQVTGRQIETVTTQPDIQQVTTFAGMDQNDQNGVEFVNQSLRNLNLESGFTFGERATQQTFERYYQAQGLSPEDSKHKVNELVSSGQVVITDKGITAGDGTPPPPNIDNTIIGYQYTEDGTKSNAPDIGNIDKRTDGMYFNINNTSYPNSNDIRVVPWEMGKRLWDSWGLDYWKDNKKTDTNISYDNWWKDTAIENYQRVSELTGKKYVDPKKLATMDREEFLNSSFFNDFSKVMYSENETGKQLDGIKLAPLPGSKKFSDLYGVPKRTNEYRAIKTAYNRIEEIDKKVQDEGLTPDTMRDFKRTLSYGDRVINNYRKGQDHAYMQTQFAKFGGWTGQGEPTTQQINDGLQNAIGMVMNNPVNHQILQNRYQERMMDKQLSNDLMMKQYMQEQGYSDASIDDQIKLMRLEFDKWKAQAGFNMDMMDMQFMAEKYSSDLNFKERSEVRDVRETAYNQLLLKYPDIMKSGTNIARSYDTDPGFKQLYDTYIDAESFLKGVPLTYKDIQYRELFGMVGDPTKHGLTFDPTVLGGSTINVQVPTLQNKTQLNNQLSIVNQQLANDPQNPQLLQKRQQLLQAIQNAPVDGVPTGTESTNTQAVDNLVNQYGG